ncbi:hypothetical protein D1007_22392 [Hordeum vulgare]|nr:hypothetical protein D1007_22392 [Hordeum vulgare]
MKLRSTITSVPLYTHILLNQLYRRPLSSPTPTSGKCGSAEVNNGTAPVQCPCSRIRRKRRGTRTLARSTRTCSGVQRRYRSMAGIHAGDQSVVVQPQASWRTATQSIMDGTCHVVAQWTSCLVHRHRFMTIKKKGLE